MKTVQLQNEEYFVFNANTKDLEVAGELTGDFILSNIKCENFQLVFHSDYSDKMYLIRVINK